MSKATTVATEIVEVDTKVSAPIVDEQPIVSKELSPPLEVKQVNWLSHITDILAVLQGISAALVVEGSIGWKPIVVGNAILTTLLLFLKGRAKQVTATPK